MLAFTRSSLVYPPCHSAANTRNSLFEKPHNPKQGGRCNEEAVSIEGQSDCDRQNTDVSVNMSAPLVFTNVGA